MLSKCQCLLLYLLLGTDAQEGVEVYRPGFPMRRLDHANPKVLTTETA